MKPNRPLFFLLLTIWSLDAFSQKDTFRSIDTRNNYFTIDVAPTFHQKPEVLEGDYAGVKMNTGMGLDAGIGMLFPVRIGKHGPYFHYSTYLSGGFSPVWFKLTLDDDDFRVPNTVIYKARQMEGDFGFRQMLYHYRRKSYNKLARTGVGIYARIKWYSGYLSSTDVLFEDSKQGIDIRMFENGPNGNSDVFVPLKTLFDLQISHGWQRLTKHNLMYGLDIYASLSLGKGYAYQYSADSPFEHIQGTIKPHPGFIGIRGSLSLTRFKTNHDNLPDRFPNGYYRHPD